MGAVFSLRSILLSDMFSVSLDPVLKSFSCFLLKCTGAARLEYILEPGVPFDLVEELLSVGEREDLLSLALFELVRRPVWMKGNRSFITEDFGVPLDERESAEWLLKAEESRDLLTVGVKFIGVGIFMQGLISPNVARFSEKFSLGEDGSAGVATRSSLSLSTALSNGVDADLT